MLGHRSFFFRWWTVVRRLCLRLLRLLRRRWLLFTVAALRINLRGGDPRRKQYAEY
jgi:hypothetical protein